SALALSPGYGAGGKIVGAVAASPPWFSQASWAAVFALASAYPIASNQIVASVDVWYNYGHAELLDGVGHGGDVFAADKRAAIKQFVDTTCWQDSYPQLNA